MISPEYVQLMSAYNKWQNESLYGAASTLSDDDRRQDRGAFFGSIHKTLAHILWGDMIWLSRFGDYPPPPGGLGHSTGLHPDWEMLKTARADYDAKIVDWARCLSPADFEGDLTWRSGSLNLDVTRPRWLLYTHFFNHQTHHRGQAHAMLTAAGAKPDATDLPFMSATAD